MGRKYYGVSEKVWIALIIIGIFAWSSGGGRYINQIVAPEFAYVGESVLVTYYCDQSEGCLLTRGQLIGWAVRGPGKFARLGTSPLQSGGGGNFATFTYSFHEVGQHCIMVGDDQAPSSFTVVKCLDVRTRPAPDVCSTRWVCIDASTSGYQNADCTYSNRLPCVYGCYDGSCRAPPAEPPSPPPPAPACGDDVCGAGETIVSCKADCQQVVPPFSCGNSLCEVGETQASCADDCGAPPVSPPAPDDGQEIPREELMAYILVIVIVAGGVIVIGARKKRGRR